MPCVRRERGKEGERKEKERKGCAACFDTRASERSEENERLKRTSACATFSDVGRSSVNESLVRFAGDVCCLSHANAAIYVSTHAQGTRGCDADG